jgi:hypothetical protein
MLQQLRARQPQQQERARRGAQRRQQQQQQQHRRSTGASTGAGAEKVMLAYQGDFGSPVSLGRSADLGQLHTSLDRAVDLYVPGAANKGCHAAGAAACGKPGAHTGSARRSGPAREFGAHARPTHTAMVKMGICTCMISSCGPETTYTLRQTWWLERLVQLVQLKGPMQEKGSPGRVLWVQGPSKA